MLGLLRSTPHLRAPGKLRDVRRVSAFICPALRAKSRRWPHRSRLSPQDVAMPRGGRRGRALGPSARSRGQQVRVHARTLPPLGEGRPLRLQGRGDRHRPKECVRTASAPSAAPHRGDAGARTCIAQAMSGIDGAPHALTLVTRTSRARVL